MNDKIVQFKISYDEKTLLKVGELDLDSSHLTEVFLILKNIMMLN